ncbi:ABC transporter permease [Halegenticoccus soli]|uniref:ABC transporter permease n=1 Tax=Halegenticoccus soli TaxID=1985678 RepID=UPI00130478F4|nr:ABC transporter permease [Halegenticoccus soli]
MFSELKVDVRPAIESVGFQKIGQYGPIFGLIGLYALFSAFADQFLTYGNQLNILRQISLIGILAVASTFPILCAEIDLSIAQMMELTGVLIAGLATGSYVAQTVSVPVAVLAGLATAVFLGGVSGFITSRFEVPSFMTTLAMLFLADGLSLTISGNRPIRGLPEALTALGGSEIFGIPSIALVFLTLLAVSQLILSYTRFGLYIYAIGGNRESAELVGINVKRVRMGVLVLSASFTVLAAIVAMGRIGSVDPNMGTGLLLPPIAAVILGGANLFGGSGNMIGTLVGVLILGVLANGLNLLGIGPDGQLVAQGIVLLVAVLANVSRR